MAFNPSTNNKYLTGGTYKIHRSLAYITYENIRSI